MSKILCVYVFNKKYYLFFSIAAGLLRLSIHSLYSWKFVMSKREDKDLQRKTIISIVQIFLLAVSLQIIYVQSKRFEEKMPISQLLQTVCWLISGGYLLCIILIYYSTFAQFLMIKENLVWELA